VSVPEIAVTMLTDDVYLFLGWPNNLTILFVWGGRIVFMSRWEWAVAVGASGFM
jgi:hypothetical protein